jgi:FAD/FMN-containing dehydrogenase
LQCDIILDFTWVDGHGKIHVTPRATEEGLAICSGMGILGIITEVTFQFTPPTHTKLITRYLSDDATLVDDIEKMLKVNGVHSYGIASNHQQKPCTHCLI